MGVLVEGRATSLQMPVPAGADGVDPLLAWRVWRVDFRRTGVRGTAPYLCSITDEEPWPAGAPMKARCRTLPHDAPVGSCRCGVYGMTEPAPPPYGLPSAGFVAVGRVALWGNVVEHEGGFRAQYGYPQRLGFFCMRCLEERRAVAAVVVVPDSPYGPLCTHHRGRLGRPVAPILRQILDTYAIDLQPAAPLGAAVASAREPEMAANYWRGVIGGGIG